MNWILVFNLDFLDPKPMSHEEAEKVVQDLASKVSRQFTKGKTAYKELNDALSSSYSDAVAALVDPFTQSMDAKAIVYSMIADEVSIFGSSVPQDQIVNIKKAVISKVKSDYSLPGYKFLEGSDKDTTEARINEIVSLGIEAAGAHVASKDEEGGYSSTTAKEKYSALQDAFAVADKKYSRINKSLAKLGKANLYELLGNGNASVVKTSPTSVLQARLQDMKGEFESGAEIENLKHLANDVFSSDMNRAAYDEYLLLAEKESILTNLERRSSGGSINSKLFMEAAMQLNALYYDSTESLLLLYGFADTKGLNTGTDFGMMESVFAMMGDGSSNERPEQPVSNHQQEDRSETKGHERQERSGEAHASTDSSSTQQGQDDWRYKNPRDYTPDDFFNAYQTAKEWNDKRHGSKGEKQEAKRATKQVKREGKNKWVAGLLAIFLGCFGAQKFYLGHKKEGAITILITVFGSFIGLGPLITGVIGIIEGVKYLIKSPEQFDQVYLIDGKKWF